MGNEILETLRTLGVTVQVIGPDRLRLEPASRIPANLVPRIREAKPEILDALRSRGIDPPRPEPCSACHSRLSWRSIYGAVICYACHAPANDSLVADILWDGEIKWHQ